MAGRLPILANLNGSIILAGIVVNTAHILANDERQRIKLVCAINFSKRLLLSTSGDPKKRLELVALKAAVEQVREEYAFSQRRACGLMTVRGIELPVPDEALG